MGKKENRIKTFDMHKLSIKIQASNEIGRLRVPWGTRVQLLLGKKSHVPQIHVYSASVMLDRLSSTQSKMQHAECDNGLQNCPRNSIEHHNQQWGRKCSYTLVQPVSVNEKKKILAIKN